MFMGVDDKQYRDAGELETDFNNGLSDRLKHQIDSLNQYYIDMLQELVRDRRLNELLPIDEIRKCINTGIMNSIRTNFTNEVVQKYGKSVPVDDSLFFMPVIDVIFNLTKLK